MVMPVLMCGSETCSEWDGYENTGYIEEGNIRKDTWDSGRVRNTENKNESGIEGGI